MKNKRIRMKQLLCMWLIILTFITPTFAGPDDGITEVEITRSTTEEYNIDANNQFTDVYVDGEGNIEYYSAEVSKDESKWFKAIVEERTMTIEVTGMEPEPIIAYKEDGFIGNLPLQGEPEKTEREVEGETISNTKHFYVYNYVTTYSKENKIYRVEYAITDSPTAGTGNIYDSDTISASEVLDTKTIEYENTDGYSGVLEKVDAIFFNRYITPSNTDDIETTVYLGEYKGIVSKKETGTIDVYKATYSGNVAKPAHGQVVYAQRLVGKKLTERLKNSVAGNAKLSLNVGDPVNIVTGSYFKSEIDFNIPTIGQNITVERHYNSTNYKEGAFGYGWTSNLDARLEIEEDGLLAIYPDGGRIPFTSTDDINYKASGVSDDKIKKSSVYELTKPNGMVYEFALDGKLIKIIEENGNTLTLNYNGDKLSTIFSATGETLTINYTGAYISKITDHTGRTYKYQYSGSNLSSVTTPLGGKKSYEYGDNGMIKAIDEMGQAYVINTMDPLERVGWQRDGEGHLTRYKYNSYTFINKMIDVEKNDVKTYEYDEDLKVNKITYGDGTYESFVYDDNNNKIEIRDRKGNTTRAVYDENSNLTSRTLPDGTVQTYTYNGSNKLTSYSRNGIKLLSYEYDAKQNIVKEEKQLSPSLKATTTYTYDTKGRMLTKTLASGQVVTFSYGSGPYPTKAVYPEGIVKKYTYDDLNRLLTETIAGETTTYTYDAGGNVKTIEDPLGHVSRMTYDLAGKMIEYKEPTNSGDGTKFVYDTNDNQTQVIDPLGNIQAKAYDGHGNVVKVFDPNTFNQSTSTGKSTDLSYSTDNQLISVTSPLGDDSTKTYDVYGNVTKSIDFEGNVRTYEYDASNRITAIKDASGKTLTAYAYDDMGYPVTITDGNGENILSTYNYVGWLLERRTPKKNESGTLYYELKKYDYDIDGRIIKEYTSKDYVTKSETPSTWHTITYTYDHLGNLTSVKDNAGAEAIYSYNAKRQKIGERYKVSEDTYMEKGFAYDAKGRLTKEWNVLLNKDFGLGDEGTFNAETSYTYDASDRLIQTTYPNGYTVHYEYDQAGRLTKQYSDVESHSVDFDHTSVSIFAKKELYAPGQSFPVELKLSPEDTVTGLNLKVTYDPRFLSFHGIKDTTVGLSVASESTGLVVLNTSSINLSEESVIGHLNFTAKESKVGLTNINIESSSTFVTDGESKNFIMTKGDTFDINGPDVNLDGFVKADDLAIVAKKVTTPSTSDIFDPDLDLDDNLEIGRSDLDLVKNWLLTYKDKEFVTDALGNFRESQVDLNYDLRSKVVEGSITYSYDKAGNIISITDESGYETTRSYDALNRLISERDPEGRVTTYTYTKNGQLKSVIPPSEESSGKGYTNSYDHLGRVTEKRNITGDLIEALSYDGNSNVLNLTDGEGNSTRYAYDAGNRLISVIKAADISPVAEYTYNVRDQIVEEKSGSQITSYERDIWGNILKTTDALGEITRYEYDLLGNLLKITDPKDGEITYTYNSMNAVSSITDQSGSVERFFYNTMGQLIEKEEKDGRRISYTYTPQGSLKEVKDKSTGDLKQYLYSKNNNLIGLINKTDITTYDLNRVGEIESVYHNGIKTHDYDYSADGNITAVTVSGHTLNYSYDRNGRLETVKDDSDLKGSYTYNGNSQLKTITYGNGLVSSFTYDGNSRIKTESYTIGSKTLQSNSYAYDLQGNMTTKTVGDLTENYTYDALNRLKTVGYSDDRVSEEYFYDELGNRSLKNIGDAQEVYTYNDVNQLIRLSAPAGVTTYTYDRRGNLTEETLNSETTTYTYNGFDQLLEVRNNQGYQVNRFDAEGNRNNVLYNGREQNKLYLGQNVLAELNNKNEEKAFYSRGTTLLETDQNVKGVGYYLSTSRGDILSVLDESGQTLNSYTYDAFGQTLNQVEEIYNPYKYAGYEQDRLKNDYYLNARTYRPDIGRFLQEDNYRGDGLNLYAYVANNPLIYVDPSGYCKQGTEGNSKTEEFEWNVLYEKVTKTVIIEGDFGLGAGVGVKAGPFKAEVMAGLFHNVTYEDGEASINQKLEAEAVIGIKDVIELGPVYEAKRDAFEMMEIPYGASPFYGIGEDPASDITGGPAVRILNVDATDAVASIMDGNLGSLIENNDFGELKKQTLGVKLFLIQGEIGIDLDGVMELNDYLNKTVPIENNGYHFRINGQ